MIQIAVIRPRMSFSFSHSPSISRPNSFVIITAHRVLHCNAETPEEMHHWIALLQRSKGDTRVQGQEFIIRGETLHLQLIHINHGVTCGSFSVYNLLALCKEK